MSRHHTVSQKILAAVLAAAFLLAACSQGLDSQPPKNDSTEEKPTQESTSGTPGSTTPPAEGTSGTGIVTPPAGGNADSTPPDAGSSGGAGTGGSGENAGGGGAVGSTDTATPSTSENTGSPESDTAAQTKAPWSNSEDYDYYSTVELGGDYADVKLALRSQIVPQAVKALLAAFPKTFGHLADWAIGFGMDVTYNDYNPTTEAAFQLTLSVDPDPAKSGHSTYEMMLNTASPSVDLPAGGALDAGKRQNLEALCIHELMHAMMYETLTCGMSGYTPASGDVAQFPDWFKEGTAEAACGGRLWRSIIKPDYTEDEIRQVLEEKTLTATSTTSQYSVGWFAVMYLAYLTNGGTSVAPAALASGLDSFLHQIHGGKSLSDAIRDSSQGKFASLADFESRFASEGAGFVGDLVAAVGDGRGSLVAKDYAVTDLLPDADHETMLFWVHFNAPFRQLNKYGDALDSYELLEGGAATYTGNPGAAVNPPSPEVLE